MSGKEARLKKTGRGLPVIGRDSHVLSIIGLMILVCIIMMLLKPESYFTGLNLRSMIFQFPEYGLCRPGKGDKLGLPELFQAFVHHGELCMGICRGVTMTGKMFPRGDDPL